MKTLIRPKVNIYLSVSIVLNLIIIIGFILLTILNLENRLIWVATLVAPLGGLSRHYLGKWLNGKSIQKRTLPYGTFLANVIGSALLMTATVKGLFYF